MKQAKRQLGSLEEVCLVPREGNSLRIGSIIIGSLKKIGGYQIFTYDLLRTLTQRGHLVDLYVPQEEYTRNKAFYCRMPFAVKPLFFNYFLLRYAPHILKTYLLYQNARNKYDLWQIVGTYPAGYVASSLAGRVPLVLRTHGEDIQKDADLNYGLRLDPRLEGLVKTTLHKMDCVVALTESVTECYRELGVPDRKIVEIPHGVDVGRFKKQSDKRETRQKWGLPLNEPLLLTVGRYHPKKGYETIPEVARVLKARGVSFSWLVVGQGTEQLSPLIKHEGVGDVLRTEREIGLSNSFTEHAELKLPDDELVRLYQCADVFVFPSRLETFGRVLIEAMAAGLPVVTTDAPGCRDVVRHGDCGLLAKPGDIEGFASHIHSLIEDESLRCHLIEKGLQHVEQYDWDIVVESYEWLYRSLLS